MPFTETDKLLIVQLLLPFVILEAQVATDELFLNSATEYDWPNDKFEPNAKVALVMVPADEGIVRQFVCVWDAQLADNETYHVPDDQLWLLIVPDARDAEEFAEYTGIPDTVVGAQFDPL
jgi:hypothetical protein